jgi:UDP-2-acetamido-3-amino-2,3-dideoxy-glucuronate N-acetyltransferase
MSKRICVVGAGRWGRNHVATLEKLGCLAGIAESDEATRQQLAAAYPRARVFARVTEAVGEGFDGYTVATPAETHFEIGAYLLGQGCSVLVEKPLALTAAEARQLHRLAGERGVTLMVGHVLLFHPAIRRIRELVAAGKIGKLEYLYSNRLNLGTVRTEENILWSFAPHDISIFQYLIGAAPLDVVSRGGAFVQPHLHDSTLTILRYPDNIVGHIFVSWLHPFKEHRLVVIGTKGMFSFEDSTAEKNLLYYEKGIDWVAGEPVPRDGPTEVIPYERKMPLTEELRYFIERLDGRAVEVAGGASGVEVLEILERASASLLDRPAPARDAEAKPPYYVHPTSIVDEGVEIGEGTKIWHFSHVQGGAKIGRKCSIGQNVNIGNNVRIGSFVKIQNNVSVYEGVELEDYVFCGPSMVFTNVLDPRAKYPQRGTEFYRRGQRHHRLRPHHRPPRLHRRGRRRHPRRAGLCPHARGPRAPGRLGLRVRRDARAGRRPGHLPAVQAGVRPPRREALPGELTPACRGADSGGGVSCDPCLV